jgi:hypothetical protein
MAVKVSLVNDTRGAVLLEYIVLIAFTGVIVAVALASLGPKVVRNYSGQRAGLYQSNP